MFEYIEMLYRNYRYAYALARYQKRCPHPFEKRMNSIPDCDWHCVQCGYIENLREGKQ